MESHQNLHTHAVDSDIQLQGNNRVLKECPSPISDEEQRLNRRQRCTLSQLRSGHCHLLQDYKHRVLGEPSDICTDCGVSPQDVRHLFACTTNPTDSSLEDIWRIRWDQFVRWVYGLNYTHKSLHHIIMAAYDGDYGYTVYIVALSIHVVTIIL